MGNYEDEFKQRLRRVCGVTDDTADVTYELDSEEGYGGCDTCGYGGSSDRAYVEVIVHKYGGRKADTIYERREFEDLGELMRALEEVEL